MLIFFSPTEFLVSKLYGKCQGEAGTKKRGLVSIFDFTPSGMRMRMNAFCTVCYYTHKLVTSVLQWLTGKKMEASGR